MTSRKVFLLTAIYLLICNCQSQDAGDNSREFNRINFFQRPQPSKSQLIEDMIGNPNRYSYILQSMLQSRKRDGETTISKKIYDNEVQTPTNTVTVGGPPLTYEPPVFVTPRSGNKRVSKGFSKELNIEDKLINLMMTLVKHGKWPCYCIDFESLTKTDT